MVTRALNYWHETLRPSTMAVWHRLDVPSWEDYHPAFQACISDVWKASQSTVQLSYLTLRPLAILCWMILEVLWQAAQVAFHVLLSRGWIQLKRGSLQLKEGAIWFCRFQMSLSRVELLGEVFVVAAAIGLFYFYKWIRQQTYWRRFMKWYAATKQKAINKTTRFVERVARVSLILAMTLPHAAFLGGYVAFKVFFPSLVKWLAHDTYATALLSMWYPLIMTISWVHDWRHGKVVSEETSKSPSTLLRKERLSPTATPLTSQNAGNRPSYMRTTTSKTTKENRNSTIRKRASGVFPRTSPSTPENHQRKIPARTPSFFVNEPEAATRYWLRYWVVYALVQAVGSIGTILPVFGSLVAQRPYVLQICGELKLLFFVWLFSMEAMIGAAVVEEDAWMAKAMPLSLIHDHITPLLLDFEAVVAASVSEVTWKTLVHSKAQGILEVLVMVKVLSERRKDWLLHVLEEGRTLLLPSLSLFMPSFVTVWGVAYVQYVVPSARSTKTLQLNKNRRKSEQGMNEEQEILYLQYWIVHCLVSGVLAYFSAVLWWVPFATHATFLLWCHFSLPKSIVQSYELVESELIAFGLLPGESELQFHETATLKVLHAVYSRLPSAADADIQGSVSSSEAQLPEAATDQSVVLDCQQESQVEAFFRSSQSLPQVENDENESPDATGNSLRITKQVSIDDDDVSDGVPPVKPSESSTTADTVAASLESNVTIISERRSSARLRKGA